MYGFYVFVIIIEERELFLVVNFEEEKYKWMEVRFFMISIIEDLELCIVFCYMNEIMYLILKDECLVDVDV